MNDTDKTTINQRLEMLVQKVDNGNRSAFARRVDLTPGAISDMLGGRMSKPGFEVLQKIALALPTVNRNWLLLGEEEMFINDSPVGPPWDSRKAPNNWQGVEDPAPEYYGYLGNFPVLTTKDNTVVPIVEADKRWNYSKRDKQNPPAPEFVKYYEPYKSLSLPISLLPHGRHMVFTVTEYSMRPTLELEDYILCSYVERDDWKNISELTICTIISKTHNPIIARVIFNSETNQITARFDNQSNQVRYGSVKFKLEDIEEIWSFTWRLTSYSENPIEYLSAKTRIEILQETVVALNKQISLASQDFRVQLKEILSNENITYDFMEKHYDSFLKRKDVIDLFELHYGRENTNPITMYLVVNNLVHELMPEFNFEKFLADNSKKSRKKVGRKPPESK